MATTYTRLQLRDFQTSSVDLTAKSHTFTLVNNNSSTAYFAMEGVRYWSGTEFVYKDVFNSASLSSLVNCTVVSGSTNAGFIIDPNATATFDFTPTATIAKSQMQFSAPNAIVYSVADTTASGSLLGVDLNLDGGIYVFANKTELQTGVNLWISDNTAALATYGEINTWDVSAVTDMGELFLEKTTFNSNISNWDVSNVTDMNQMFRGAVSFNQPLNSWDVSNVTVMNSMFSSATSFNQPIGGWTLSSLTDVNNMFSNADAFDQPLNAWDVSSVTNMNSMFSGADIFNQPLNSWDVSNVTTMSNMFKEATTFNQPLNNWDVSNVTNMGNMFSNADAFQQPLNLWTPNSLSGEFGGGGFMGIKDESSAITYTLLDTLLNGWVVDYASLQSNVTINFGDSTFTSAGLDARNILVNDKGWTITDGGQV
jgi:surface protein